MQLTDQLTLLVDELLDAHEDTVRLSAGLVLDWRWHAHVRYLRELRRLGREALAAATADGPSKTFRSAHGTRVRRLRSNLQRRGARRCARNGHGEGPT